jgi:YD repeat-containing protein
VTLPGSVITSFTYQSGATCVSTFNQMTSMTDPLGNVTNFGRDAKGNLTSIAPPEHFLIEE